MSNNSEENLLTPDPALLDIDDADDLFIKPKKKYKIIMISDHQLAPSGVGIQARFLIEGLLKTGKYTFKCLGGAIKHANYNLQVVNDDFIIKPVDGFGTKEMVRELLIMEQPDALLLFTDPRQFIWLWEMEDEIHQLCPITYWHVWDNDPFPEFNIPFYQSTELINCLARKTYDLVKPHFPEKTHYVPHTFPKHVYFPLPEDQIKDLMSKNFPEREDWFKVLWVNRNATRKVPSDVIAAWALFLNNLEKKYGHRKALMIMHTDPKDNEGPNLLAVTHKLNLSNNVWFSTEKIDFGHMNVLHNLTDTTVNIAKNEGFGLTTAATLYCGKPVIALCTGGETSKVTDYRDNSENGVALKPIKRLLVGSQLVPYIYEDLACTKETADAFMKIFEMTAEDKKAMREKVLEFMDHAFKYEDMIEKWDRTLEEAILAYKAKKEKSGGTWDLVILNPILDAGKIKLEDNPNSSKTDAHNDVEQEKKKKKKKKLKVKRRKRKINRGK